MTDSDPHIGSSLTDYQAFQPKGPFIATMAAPRESGKTYLIEKLLLEGNIMQGFDSIIIASPTFEFKDCFPIEDKFKGMCIKIRSNFKTQISQLLDEVKHANKMHFEKPDKYEPHYCLVILDDIIDSKLASYRSSENIVDELAERGRHYNTSLIVSAQYLSAISPSVRRNSTYLFLWSPCNFSDMERVLQEYVPRKARQEFLLLLQRAFLKQYSFVLINNEPENRKYFKKRFYIGFTQMMFSMKGDEAMLYHLDKKHKKQEKEDTETENEDEEEEQN